MPCAGSPNREGHLTLLDHDFLRGLSPEHLKVLAGLAHEVTFEENQVVLEDGQASSSFYLLLRGSVAVELRTPSYAVCVQALGEGQVFGWSALLDDQDTLFRVRAREHTTAVRFDGRELKSLCHRIPHWEPSFYKGLCKWSPTAYERPRSGSPKCAAYAYDTRIVAVARRRRLSERGCRRYRRHESCACS